MTTCKWRACASFSLACVCCSMLMYVASPQIPTEPSEARRGPDLIPPLNPWVESGVEQHQRTRTKPQPKDRERSTGVDFADAIDSQVSKYVELTQSKEKEAIYRYIVDLHFLEMSRTANHCRKQMKVPPPSEFFRVHEHIVNPYPHSVLLAPPLTFCGDVTFAIVITMSYHSNDAERMAIRHTYGNSTWLHQEGYTASPATIKQLFLFGVHKDNKLNEKIRAEHSTYGDILQGSFEESYKTLGFKSRMALQWISNECPQARYIIKADDDVVVNMPKLHSELRSRVEHRSMIGHCDDREPVHRKPSSKFFSPCNEFPYDRRPTYMDGPMYVMTSDVAGELFLVAQHMKDYFIDDAFISGFLTIPLNVTLRCERGYGVNAKEDQPRMAHPDKFIISARDPAEMRSIWEAIKHTTTHNLHSSV